MSDVSLSKAVRSNLLSLQNTSAMMSKTQDRLSTGNKVNSALDNPTNFFTASSLNGRAGDLNQLMDGMANGIQTIEAANNGLTSISKTLESMQSTLRQARQDKSFQSTSYDAALTDGVFVADSEITFDGGAVTGTDVAIDVAGLTVDGAVAAINTAAEEGGTLAGAVRASNDNGKLRIENLSTEALTTAGTTSITGTEIEGNSVRAGLVEQYNNLRDTLDKLSDDSSFNGINLLRGDNLKITFNETGTSDIDIQSKVDGTDGASINSATLGLDSIADAGFDSDTAIDALLTDVKSAVSSVRSQASSFGSSLSIVQNRQDFTKSMVNTLQTGAANLTLADMNQEAANLLALQTRQSLSQSSLSLASQADQSVLQLIR